MCDLGSIGEDHHFGRWLIKYVLPMLRARPSVCVCLFVPSAFEFFPESEYLLMQNSSPVSCCSDPEHLFARLSVCQYLSIFDRFNSWVCQSATLNAVSVHQPPCLRRSECQQTCSKYKHDIALIHQGTTSTFTWNKQGCHCPPCFLMLVVFQFWSYFPSIIFSVRNIFIGNLIPPLK